MTGRSPNRLSAGDIQLFFMFRSGVRNSLNVVRRWPLIGQRSGMIAYGRLNCAAAAVSAVCDRFAFCGVIALREPLPPALYSANP